MSILSPSGQILLACFIALLCPGDCQAEIRWLADSPERLVESQSSFKDVRTTPDYWEGIVADAVDPMVVLHPVEVDAGKEKYLYLKFCAEKVKSVQVFFSKESPGAFREEESFKTLNFEETVEPRIYRIRLSEVPRWKGTLRSLRIDPDSTNTGSWVRLCGVGVSESAVRDGGILEMKIQAQGVAAHIAQTEPLSPEEEAASFTLPPGFEAQLVASEPDIPKPLNLNFDHRGRLWATGSRLYPHHATEEGKGIDTVSILEDFDENGRARKITTFADDLNIPIGVLPTQDGAIVWSIPNVYRLYDRDGDDRAEDREILFGPFGYEDTHGNISNFHSGIDGWVYANHGFRNESKVTGKDGHSIEMTSGHTWRFKRDGSRCEIVAVGQVNPFGIAFDPLGNLYTADCHTKPLYQIMPGATYPSFSRTDGLDGLGFGPEICVHSHDSTAISGVVYYDADHFPEEYRGTTFIGNVVTNRINHDRLQRNGGTYQAMLQPDFLVSHDPWFRPVNIKLGPDGALYVADFYNSVIGHYEVPLDHPARDYGRGRIWRIVYKGEEETSPATLPAKDWSREPVEGLISALSSPNQSIRFQVTDQLAWNQTPVEEALRDALKVGAMNEDGTVHALWVLERRGSLSEEDLAHYARNESVTVRSHILRIIETRKEMNSAMERMALAGLKDADGYIRRRAAQALRAHPSPDRLIPLLEALKETPAEDVQLTHALKMAARDQLKLEETWDSLNSNPHFHYYQMILPPVALGSNTGQAAKFLLSSLDRFSVAGKALMDYARHIARFGQEEDLASLYPSLRDRGPQGFEEQVDLLSSFMKGVSASGHRMPAEYSDWAKRVSEQGLSDPGEQALTKCIELARDYGLVEAVPTLCAMACEAGKTAEVRLEACESLLELDRENQMARIGALLADGNESFEIRRGIARLLGRYTKAGAVEVLAVNLETAPSELAREIASSLAGSEEGAEQLLAKIETGRASRHLLTERDISQKIESRRNKELSERMKTLTKGIPSLEERIAEIISERRDLVAKLSPHPEEGRAIFEKNCAICHRLGELGNKIGPELDGIGGRGVERLLEDVLDPNRIVDPAYRTTIVELDSGESYIGLLKGEEGEVVLIADSLGEIHRIPKDAIVEQRISQLSPMPSNLASDLPEKEFGDLMGFLLEQRVQN